MFSVSLNEIQNKNVGNSLKCFCNCSLKTIIFVLYTHLILLYQIFQRVHVACAQVQVAHFTAAGDQTRQCLQITQMFLVC